jgi:hypothetical protein
MTKTKDDQDDTKDYKGNKDENQHGGYSALSWWSILS